VQTSILTCVILLSIIFILTITVSLQNGAAQQDLYNQSKEIPFSNFTASIPLASSLLEILKSKINVSLDDAMANVTNSFGPNSTTLSGSVQSESGFLVYRVVVLDSDNNIHLILVDPANGDILSQRQWPAAMPKALSEIPGVDPRLDGIPDLRAIPGIDPSMRIP
jgi:hypothetical protein